MIDDWSFFDSLLTSQSDHGSISCESWNEAHWEAQMQEIHLTSI